MEGCFAVQLLRRSPNLARVFALRAGPALLAATGPNLGHFGQVVAEEVEPAVAMVERHREFPAHVKYDALGQHRESIEFHPAHLDAGRAIWASGMLALPNDRAGDFEMAGLFYLLSTSARVATPARSSARPALLGRSAGEGPTRWPKGTSTHCAAATTPGAHAGRSS